MSNFQASGYKVILNRFGSLPMGQCTVTSVSPGQAIIQPITAGAKTLAQTAVYTTVYVTADCTHPITTPSTSSSSS